MQRNCVDRFFGIRHKTSNNAKLQQPLNGNPSTIRSCRACGDFTTSMGACVSCDRRNNRGSPAIEHLRGVRRQHNVGSAVRVFIQHKGDGNVKTNSSAAADDVESATTKPRVVLHKIDSPIYPVSIPPSTFSTSSERSGSAKCIWSDDELLDSLRRDSRYVYVRPTARTQVFFRDPEPRGSDTSSSDNEEATCFSFSGDTLYGEVGYPIKCKITSPVSVPT